MNTPALSQETLADRLRVFRFESPGAPRLVDELARKTGWPPARAQRVVEEYRRFLWIVGTATDLVGPSPDVDEAWHLHLLDTRSYWEELCPKVLGRPLHHERGRGGLVGSKQLDEAYRRTLAAYRAAFGEPPRDVWPAPVDGDAGAEAVPDVSAARRGARLRWLAAAVSAAALALGAALARHELRRAFADAPDYWYLLGVTAVALALWPLGARARRRVLRPDDAPTEAELAALDPYDLAYLSGGPRAAVSVALTELVAAGRLTVDARGVRPTDAGHAPPERVDDTPLRRLVLASVLARPRATVDEQIPSSRRVRALLEPPLIAGGFLAPRAVRLAADAFMVGLPLTTVVLILLRVGLTPHPSALLGFGVVMLPLVTALFVIPLASPSPATGRGDLALARRKARFSLPPASTRVDEDFASLVALFGAGALRASTLAPLADLLAPPPSASPSCGGCGG